MCITIFPFVFLWLELKFKIKVKLNGVLSLTWIHEKLEKKEKLGKKTEKNPEMCSWSKVYDPVRPKLISKCCLVLVLSILQ